eukprot:6202590-Pleurochrysis_carterae.AAC.4
MNGIGLRTLLPKYVQLHRERRLAAVCVQEHIPHAGSKIASALGPSFAVAMHDSAPRLAIVYDRSRLSLRRLTAILLPRIEKVPFWQRLYTAGTPEKKHALVANFSPPLTVVNFHLDTAGDNEHRTAQIRAFSSALPLARTPLVVCGDTNAFTIQQSKADEALRSLLRPLNMRHNLRDARSAENTPTHFFARANEPMIGQRIAVAFGLLGIDFPRRYDVVCSNVPVLESGQVETPESDHDLVWASLQMPRFEHRARRFIYIEHQGLRCSKAVCPHAMANPTATTRERDFCLMAHLRREAQSGARCFGRPHCHGARILSTNVVASVETARSYIGVFDNSFLNFVQPACVAYAARLLIPCNLTAQSVPLYYRSMKKAPGILEATNDAIFGAALLLNITNTMDIQDALFEMEVATSRLTATYSGLCM